MTARYFDVDCLFVDCAWPETKKAQADFLRGLHGRLREEEIADRLKNNLYENIENLNLDVGYGPRWFHIWKPSVGTGLVVLKQPPTSALCVQCTLTARLQHLRVEFSTLSGTPFASKDFSGVKHQPR